jgi:hypothetical protein
MLFNYRYVNHSIERFQSYLDHLVKEVWCKATDEFSLELLHPDLNLIVTNIFNDESITTDHLDGPIRRIYDLFKTKLTDDHRRQIADWYDHNNNIEALCTCDPHKPPVTYAEIRAINADLELELKTFCINLFTNVIRLKAVTSNIGEIDEHYRAFVSENKDGKCPFCGYADIKGVYQEPREAYDHFLPKSRYPFNSVNFRNLVPMCHECNSTYKAAKDPLQKKAGDRRRAFYSYAAKSPDITLEVILKTRDVTNLRPQDIDLQLGSPGRDEEVGTWKDIFGVEERYKAKLCSKNDGLAWLQQVIEEPENIDMSRHELLNMIMRCAERYPFDGANFLKKSFLDACKKAKLI